ncbi:MAG: hypothetical protein IMZ44_06120 [Planctomycetes bacterium]|nr:hypothetical protein [Planctomycetota bacterium]
MTNPEPDPPSLMAGRTLICCRIASGKTLTSLLRHVTLPSPAARRGKG